jgi:hypothetical protein
LTLSVALLGIFAAVVVAAVGPSDGTSTLPASSTGTTETTETDNAGVDISGPCDEAEHAGDPRCTGVAPRVEDGDRHGRHGDDDRFDDHGGDVDNSGPGSDNSGPGTFDDDDHSGSGHGGGDDHGRNSGHGGGDDD